MPFNGRGPASLSPLLSHIMIYAAGVTVLPSHRNALSGLYSPALKRLYPDTQHDNTQIPRVGILVPNDYTQIPKVPRYARPFADAHPVSPMRYCGVVGVRQGATPPLTAPRFTLATVSERGHFCI